MQAHEGVFLSQTVACCLLARTIWVPDFLWRYTLLLPIALLLWLLFLLLCQIGKVGTLILFLISEETLFAFPLFRMILTGDWYIKHLFYWAVFLLYFKGFLLLRVLNFIECFYSIHLLNITFIDLCMFNKPYILVANLRYLLKYTVHFN